MREAEAIAKKFNKQAQKSLDDHMDKADVQYLGYESKIKIRDGTRFLNDRLVNAKNENEVDEALNASFRDADTLQDEIHHRVQEILKNTNESAQGTIK